MLLCFALEEMENTPIASRVNFPNGMTSEGACGREIACPVTRAAEWSPSRVPRGPAKPSVSSFFRGRTVHAVEAALPDRLRPASSRPARRYADNARQIDVRHWSDTSDKLAVTSSDRAPAPARQAGTRRREGGKDDADGGMPVFAEDGGPFPSSGDIMTVYPSGDIFIPDIEDVLLTAFIISMENDGKNRAQLEWTNTYTFVDNFVRHRLWHDSVNGWPRDTSQFSGTVGNVVHD
ncbi:hypothetical protein F5148DRAFT_1285231 [Russula earlei]|uniref:Uncharacterized protein n=1 Tax=Russula earlei TaxID=71964 RepID=A0ACC0U7J5_9AGAM|nr:hypothetical protein F5148DRAFT_1285231 [Russula earlei]